MSGRPRLCLASASPRRRKLLEQLGIAFEVCVPEISEIWTDDDPAGTVERNARAKALHAQCAMGGGFVLAADTVLSFEGRCIGKPSSLADARAMLRRLSGHTHRVVTCAVLRAPDADRPPLVKTDQSSVRFRPLADSDIERYMVAVNPLDKAGSYNIDQHGEIIIESFEGSRSNIMGLCIETVEPWLRQYGIR